MSSDEQAEVKETTEKEEIPETRGVFENVTLKRRPQSDIFEKYELEMTFLIKLLGEDWCYQLDCKDITSLDKIMQRLKKIADSPNLPALIKKKLEE